MNEDCKYVLVWGIICFLILSVLAIPFTVYCYKINSKFIQNGYQHTTIVGYEGLVWRKN